MVLPGPWRLASLITLLLSPAVRAQADLPFPNDRAEGRAETPEQQLEQEAMGRRLQVALRTHGADIYGCYDKAQGQGPGPGQSVDRRELSGEVLVRLWVARGGSVSRVDMLKEQMAPAGHAGIKVLTDCLAAAMRRWDVPELAGVDTNQIVFPLVFKPDGSKPDGSKPASGSAAAAVEVKAPRYVVPLSEGKPGPIGHGTVEARVLIDTTTVGVTKASLTQLVLHQSARLAPHTHPGVLEALYVVKGLARVRSAQRGVVVNANVGDLIVVPPSGLHSIEAAPLAPLTLIQIFAPGGPEHAYRDPSDRSGTQPARPTERPTDPPVVVRAAEPKTLSILGGKGSVQLFLDALPVGQAAVDRMEASAGAEVPLHAHDTSDEVLYILQGRGTMEVGGETHAVVADDAIHIPAGVPHSLRVSEKLVALQCYSPGGPEQRFKKPAPSHQLPEAEKR